MYESGTLYLEKYIGGYDTATFYCGFSECGNLKELTDDEINNQMVNKYKHTFKKNSDKKKLNIPINFSFKRRW